MFSTNFIKRPCQRLSISNLLQVNESKLSTLCDFSKKNNQATRTAIYQEAITISNDDPEITAEDAIHKGFAYLTVDKNLFSWSALECFEKAKSLDSKHKYLKEIECGIKQAKSNQNNKSCYPVVKPQQ